MSASQNPPASDRRADLRLAGSGKIDAVVVNEGGLPVEAVEGAKVLNVSAGGLAMMARSRVQPGSVLSVRVVTPQPPSDESAGFRLETLDSAQLEQSQHKIRCRLVAGHIPAQLIYNW